MYSRALYLPEGILNYLTRETLLLEGVSANFFPSDALMCPNPDFNQPEHRWRMVQRSLVEAIADELDPGGKVFLQSDVEEVARRMREQFLTEGKQKLVIDDSDNDCNGWLKENPFGVRSDWERHVLARKLPMYRLMFYKTEKVV